MAGFAALQLSLLPLAPPRAPHPGPPPAPMEISDDLLAAAARSSGGREKEGELCHQPPPHAPSRHHCSAARQTRGREGGWGKGGEAGGCSWGPGLGKRRLQRRPGAAEGGGGAQEQGLGEGTFSLHHLLQASGTPQSRQCYPALGCFTCCISWRFHNASGSPTTPYTLVFWHPKAAGLPNTVLGLRSKRIWGRGSDVPQKTKQYCLLQDFL